MVRTFIKTKRIKGTIPPVFSSTEDDPGRGTNFAVPHRTGDVGGTPGQCATMLLPAIFVLTLTCVRAQSGYDTSHHKGRLYSRRT